MGLSRGTSWICQNWASGAKLHSQARKMKVGLPPSRSTRKEGSCLIEEEMLEGKDDGLRGNNDWEEITDREVELLFGGNRSVFVIITTGVTRGKGSIFFFDPQPMWQVTQKVTVFKQYLDFNQPFFYLDTVIFIYNPYTISVCFSHWLWEISAFRAANGWIKCHHTPLRHSISWKCSHRQGYKWR